MKTEFLPLIISLAAWCSGSSPAAQAPSYTSAGSLPLTGRIDAVSGQIIENVHVTNPSGPCIVVKAGVSNVTVRNSEIGPCGQTTRAIRDFGIFVVDGATNVVVSNNIIHDASSGLTAINALSPIVFDRNFVYNIRGPIWAGQMVQFNNLRPGSGRTKITCNVFDGRINTPVAGPNSVEDHISVYSSSGDQENPIEIAYNRIRGSDVGGSQSGSGMQLGDSKAGGGAKGVFDGGGWIWAHDNTIVRVSGVGISVTGGSNQLVENNRVENLGDQLSSMTGWAYAAVANAPGTNVTFRNNLGAANLWAYNHDGSSGSGIFKVKSKAFSNYSESGNVFGPAAKLSPNIYDEKYSACN